MTVDEIIELARTYLDDTVAPYLWSDDFLLGALNRAEEEVTTRTLCLYDDQTTEICELTLAAGVTRYAISPLIVQVDSISHGGMLLEQVNPVDMDRLYGSSWRPSPGVPVSWYAKDARTIHLTSAPSLSVDGEPLTLGVYRLPATPLAGFSDVPEVPAWMHRAMVHWLCAEAYLVVDADNQRPDLAVTHMEQFDRYFGPSVASQVRLTERSTPRPVKTLTAPYPTMLSDVQHADWNGRAEMKRDKRG